MTQCPGPGAIAPRVHIDRHRAFDKFLVRGRSDDARFVTAVETATSLKLPVLPNRSSGGSDRALLWVSPTGWLLVGDARAPADRLARRLKGALGDVIDVSDEYDRLRIGGVEADELLATCCALDLSARSLEVGMVARTLVAGIRGIAFRPCEASLDLYVDISQADALLDRLHMAAREFRDRASYEKVRAPNAP